VWPGQWLASNPSPSPSLRVVGMVPIEVVGIIPILVVGMVPVRVVGMLRRTHSADWRSEAAHPAKARSA
jgi:uncharacterized membrane protein